MDVTVEQSVQTCAGTTKSGTPCKRRAVRGSRFCAAHGATKPTPAAAHASTAQQARTAAPPHAAAANGTAGDIDRGALDEVISALRDGGGGFSATAAASTVGSAMDELMHVLELAAGSLRRLRDAAVDMGLVDSTRAERFAADLGNAAVGLSAAMAHRLSGEFEEDDFGFDETFTAHLQPLAKLFYDYYWRVDVDGIANVPAEGRCLLVSNHAGAGLPFDGAMIKMAIMQQHARPRHARMLVLDWAMGLPWVGDLMKMTGQALACTPNAVELLERDQLVGVFPEGVKGMSKPFSQRYELQRFGRGGFVRIALRTRSPIVPVAVVGSEEIYPKIANFPLLNKLIGAPFVPVTPLFPLLGLAGLVPLPSKWHIEFCDPIDVSGYPREAADDRQFVLEMSEQIRTTIQHKLRENLLKRHTPFW